MKVFILGGTGSIGRGLVEECLRRKYEITALSRSREADETYETLGIDTVRGDLASPEKWVHHVIGHDALVHVASTFDETMERLDKHLVNTLAQALAFSESQFRLIYTGGCWLYGETGDRVVDENSGFEASNAYHWMSEFSASLLANNAFRTAIVHPAMVYHQEGGVFEEFLTAAREKRRLEIWGKAAIRWPLIERSDLAKAYCTLLEQPKLVGHYNVSAEEGVWVSDIVKAFEQRFGIEENAIELDTAALIEEYGAWVAGFSLDQQMSSAKLRLQTAWRPVYTDFRRSPLFV